MKIVLTAICPDYLWKNTSRGVASPKTCRPGPTNFWFDHSTVCNKLCIVGVCRKAKSSKCWWGQCVLVTCAIFRICRNESQPGLQLVEKLAKPLTKTHSCKRWITLFIRLISIKWIMQSVCLLLILWIVINIQWIVLSNVWTARTRRCSYRKWWLTYNLQRWIKCFICRFNFALNKLHYRSK